MKTEELLKNISDLLKKHEDFLNNNPELFYAIENRLLKAINDEDEEDSDYDWTNPEKGEYDEEDEDGSGYGDDLFDKVPSEEADDEDERYIRGEDEDGDGDVDEDDEASRWLREHGEEPEDEDSGFDFDPSAAREDDEESDVGPDEDEAIQPEVPKKPEEPKKSSSRYVDWKPQDKYSDEHQKAIEQHMKDGFSHREAERMAGAHKAPSDFYSALRSSTKPSEPSPKMLEKLKSHAHDWLRNAERKQMESAEAEHNPQKHATGKAIAAHEEAHKDFETAHGKFLQSDELKGLTGRARHQAIQAWKKNWEAENPQHREKAIAAANAGKAFGEAAEARKQRIAEGQRAILDSGKSFGEGMTGEFSSDAAGAGEDHPMTASAAGQMVGGEQNEDGGFATNIKKDPAAVFAERNPEYIKHLQSKLNPQQTQRLSAIDSLKNKGNK